MLYLAFQKKIYLGDGEHSKTTKKIPVFSYTIIYGKLQSLISVLT